MPQVFICRRIPEVGLKKLKQAGLEVDVYDSDLAIPRPELIAQLQQKPYQALLTTLADQVDEELLAEAPGLKIVANYAVGYNNIDLEACRASGVRVSNTPGVLSEATADHCFALILACARRIVEGHALVTSGNWQGWAPTQMLGQDITGKTLGILGLGRIGKALAQRAKGFDMEVLYHNRKPDEEAEGQLGLGYCSLHELFERSDVISVNVPLNAETHHLVDAALLKRMKPNAILINTARGPIVDEQALVRALQEGQLWAAGLDVYEQEPVVSEALKHMPNVVLAPHLGSATEGTREAMINLAVEAIIGVLAGQEVPQLLV